MRGQFLGGVEPDAVCGSSHQKGAVQQGSGRRRHGTAADAATTAGAAAPNPRAPLAVCAIKAPQLVLGKSSAQLFSL